MPIVCVCSTLLYRLDLQVKQFLVSSQHLVLLLLQTCRGACIYYKYLPQSMNRTYTHLLCYSNHVHFMMQVSSLVLQFAGLVMTLYKFNGCLYTNQCLIHPTILCNCWVNAFYNRLLTHWSHLQSLHNYELPVSFKLFFNVSI